MPAIDINRGTTNVVLPEEVSTEIWGATVEGSAFMSAARRITIPGTGLKVQTITGEPQADWVDETGVKPVSEHTFGKKTITPYKLAVIEAFSMEFMRDADALYAELVRRLPLALDTKFDKTIMGTTAPGSGFDVLGSATAVSLTPASGNTVYDQFITVDGNIAAAGGVMDHIILAPQGRAKVLAAVDGDKRPLFTAGVTTGAISPILGASVSTSRNVYVDATTDILGIAGDFTKMLVGNVEGIKISISDQATLGTGENAINLWQQNMVAVRAEVEVCAAVEGTGYFNLLTA
jgi:HK97 family phage major capsid protein